MITTTIAEMMQAMLKDNAVLFVKDIEIIGVSKRIIIAKILIICSKNSVKLIAKNCFCPHKAPRNTSYIELKIKAGSNNINISVDAFDVKRTFSKLGNKRTIKDTVAQIIAVNIKPELTTDPIYF